MDLKSLIPLLATIGGIVFAAVGWVSSGFPPLSTKSYVDGIYWQLACKQYKNQLRINEIDLYQWQQNPRPYSTGVQAQINALTADTLYINGQFVQNCN